MKENVQTRLNVLVVNKFYLQRIFCFHCFRTSSKCISGYIYEAT